MQCAEMILSYDDDIAGFVKHWKTGGRMVTTEYIEVI
jgi:hypothetical protein